MCTRNHAAGVRPGTDSKAPFPIHSQPLASQTGNAAARPSRIIPLKRPPPVRSAPPPKSAPSSGARAPAPGAPRPSPQPHTARISANSPCNWAMKGSSAAAGTGAAAVIGRPSRRDAIWATRSAPGWRGREQEQPIDANKGLPIASQARQKIRCLFSACVVTASTTFAMRLPPQKSPAKRAPCRAPKAIQGLRPEDG